MFRIPTPSPSPGQSKSHVAAANAVLSCSLTRFHAHADKGLMLVIHALTGKPAVIRLFFFLPHIHTSSINGILRWSSCRKQASPTQLTEWTRLLTSLTSSSFLPSVLTHPQHRQYLCRARYTMTMGRSLLIIYPSFHGLVKRRARL